MSADKYYTLSIVAEKCCNVLKNVLKIDYDKDLIIEPSAGQGAFIKPIYKLCKNSIFIDKYPMHKNVIKMDYLKFNVDVSKFKKVHIVGNPPFGFKASMAIKFIKHSVKFCDTIAFILPRSFAKYSMQKSMPLNFHLARSMSIPQYAFLYKNKKYNVPCIFQIWVKKYKLRRKLQKIKTIGYKFTKYSKKADFAVRRVGSKSGHIFIDNIANKNKNSHYFIILNRKSDINKIRNISSKNIKYTTGPFSISKYDIIKNLNKRLL
jgi:predicted RNA methylase